MLAQPLVENAIKHGVSGMGQFGTLHISAQMKGKNMEFIISDNGPGFDHTQPVRGLGIRLVNSRIKVLQSQGHTIHLSFGTGPERGTRAIMLFKNWI
jgi:LytS/YehU family sensor histidine kinase